jgi:tetratricopeptide (TPR) repeat protein
LVANEMKLGSSESAAYGALAGVAMAEGERLGAEGAAQAAIATSETAAERAKGYEELADLLIESGESFGDADWAARLEGLPPGNHHPTLALIDARRGDLAAAMRHVEATPVDFAQSYTRGLVHFELGQFAVAVRHLERALGEGAPHFPWDDVLLGEVRAWLGVAMQRAGDSTGAIEPLEQARWILGLCCGGRSVLAQETRFALAQALWDTGGDRARAKQLATEAHVALAAMGPALEKKAAAVAAWLEGR